MSDVKVNYYEVMQDTAMHELDGSSGDYAFPVKSESGGKWTVKKGQYVKSFGQTKTMKNINKLSETYLVLVNGNGVVLKDVTLFENEVDDCGCDAMPIAKPTDMEKLEESKKHNQLDKESAYMNKKARFDKNGIFGFLIGAAIGALIGWVATKDKKKTIFIGLAGAFIGMVIGYLIGRKGTKKIDAGVNVSDMEKTIASNSIQGSDSNNKNAENQEFFQLGQNYDFTVPNTVFALMYADDTFYAARDNEGKRIMITPDKIFNAKLIEVKDPQIFVADPKSKQINKVKSKKPLPFVKIGESLYVPLALTDKSSVIYEDEVVKYLNGSTELEDEIYVKGRYAGKKQFYLAYLPAHDMMIRKLFKLN